MEDPGIGGPWEWRTLRVADPESSGSRKLWTLGVANTGRGGPREWRAVTTEAPANFLKLDHLPMDFVSEKADSRDFAFVSPVEI